MEKWKPIPGYEGIYEVSDFGSVKRIGSWPNRNRIHGLMHPEIGKLGYSRVRLRASGRYERFLVHRLVTLAFLGPCPEHQCVNHINGKRSDNRIENLEYVTYSQNVLHSYRVLGAPHREGSKHPLAVLTEREVLKMRHERIEGASIKSIALQYGIHRSHAASILRGDMWKHI